MSIRDRVEAFLLDAAQLKGDFASPVPSDVLFFYSIQIFKGSQVYKWIFVKGIRNIIIETLREKPVIFTNLYPIQTCYIH